MRNYTTPDLLRMGIVKRKLTREEARAVTEEVLAMKLNDPSANFTMAIVKTIERVNGVQP